MSFKGVIFDLDGVITKTASVHFRAWKSTFEDYLKKLNLPFRSFTKKDYLDYVDGKPRYEGVKSFLNSRGIRLPYGTPQDDPDKETICGIGNRKNVLFRRIIQTEGAEVFSSSIDFINQLKRSNLKIGLATSSKNGSFILESLGITNLFSTIVDGLVSSKLNLKGKPESDIFITAANNLGIAPAELAVVEDSSSGVEAGRNGGFGLVIGVARENNQSELLNCGADIVVTDLSDINVAWIKNWFELKPADLFKFWEKPRDLRNLLVDKILVNSSYKRSFKLALNNRKPVFFLDYDGTLTPIVSRPELALLSESMRNTLKELSKYYVVAIVSGRERKDVENLVKIPGIFYAGSHGFDIKGRDLSMIHPAAEKIAPTISKLAKSLKSELLGIPGLIIEEKKFSLAIHYRLVKQKKYLDIIKDIVKDVIKTNPGLRLMSGKKVFELLPNVDWNKGKAIKWIMSALNISFKDFSVTYIGDDVTDEDAFRIIRTRGTGILVSEEPRASAADFRVSSPKQVQELFQKLL